MTPLEGIPPRGQERREQILETIRQRPGIHKRLLMETTNMASGALTHHLRRLLQEQRIQILRLRGRVLYFPPNVPPEHVPWLESLRQAKPVLQKLEESERSIAGLCQDLGLPRKIVRRHLLKLREAGIVERGNSYHGRFKLRRATLEEIRRYAFLEE